MGANVLLQLKVRSELRMPKSCHLKVLRGWGLAMGQRFPPSAVTKGGSPLLPEFAPVFDSVNRLLSRRMQLSRNCYGWLYGLYL